MSAPQETIRQRILRIQQELGIEPKKSLGQNFLVSDSAITKIIAAAEKLQPQFIVEIGPGLGSLTSRLMQLNIPLTLVELDHVFADYWRKQGMTLHEVDALQWNWKELPNPEKTILVSNLPYQISSSIVVDRCIDPHPLAGMVLMFQKEVAQRMRALPETENYGMLSVLAQSFWQIETVLEASSGDFMPPPKVASRVLSFKLLPSPVEDKQQYLRFLKGCFVQPRKMMLSNMMHTLGRTREDLQAIFDGQTLDYKIRAQQLKIAQFLQLYRALGYR